MLAVWVDTGLVLADQFRDGNVPAQMEPLVVVQQAFTALPGTAKEFYHSGDSACHESRLANWLRDGQREGGAARRVRFLPSVRRDRGGSRRKPGALLHPESGTNP